MSYVLLKTPDKGLSVFARAKRNRKVNRSEVVCEYLGNYGRAMITCRGKSCSEVHLDEISQDHRNWRGRPLRKQLS